MNDKPFDISKPYRTRDGLEAWVVQCPEPVRPMINPNGADVHFIGYVKQANGNRAYGWHRDGSYALGTARSLDLVNIPERKTVKVWLVWRHPWPRGEGIQTDRVFVEVHQVRQEGLSTLGNIIAQKEVEVTYEVGEGLEDEP